MSIVDADRVKEIFAPLQKKAEELTRQVESLNATEKEKLAAADGGYDGNGTRSEIQSSIKARKQELYAEIDAAAVAPAEKLAEYLSRSFEIDPSVLEKWAPIFNAMAFSDDDLQSIARKFPNYTMLRACASNGRKSDSKFGKQLEKKLEDYRESVEKSTKKLVKAAKRGVKSEMYSFGASELFSHRNMWPTFVSDALENIQALNDDLSSFLSGEKNPQFGDPIMNRLAEMAND